MNDDDEQEEEEQVNKITHGKESCFKLYPCTFLKKVYLSFLLLLMLFLLLLLLLFSFRQKEQEESEARVQVRCRRVKWWLRRKLSDSLAKGSCEKITESRSKREREREREDEKVTGYYEQILLFLWDAADQPPIASLVGNYKEKRLKVLSLSLLLLGRRNLPAQMRGQLHWCIKCPSRDIFSIRFCAPGQL